MKNLKILSLLIVFSILVSSCLKEDLAPVTRSSANSLTDVQFEYRWTVKNAGGVDVLKFQSISVAKTIDITNNTVTLNLTVPAATGDFTSGVRANVTQSNLACLFFVSPAANVKPLNGAPMLGIVGDFSAGNYQYQVIAANGDVKVWTIKIASFNK